MTPLEERCVLARIAGLETRVASLERLTVLIDEANKQLKIDKEALQAEVLGLTQDLKAANLRHA
jgi:hypothetical protein